MEKIILRLTSPIPQLVTLKNRADKLSADLNSALDVGKFNELVTEKQGLLDRQIAQQHLSAISDEIKRLEKLSRLENSVTETNTRAITTLGNSIADDIITPQLEAGMFLCQNPMH